MIKARRQKRILEVLRREGAIELSELARILPGASVVTLRRDVAELADAGALKRTHGGAVLPDAELLRSDAPTLRVIGAETNEVDQADAVILPPVAGPGASALRRHIQRSNRPFLAESAEQAGGVYLGPDNGAAGYALGLRAARDLRPDDLLLMICQPELANTTARAMGFEAGLTSVYPALQILRVNGHGSYKQSLRVAQDAFRTEPRISTVFGVNDHATQAGIEAASRTGIVVKAYGMGGESPDFLARLQSDDALFAVAALFPDLVGRIGVDLIAAAFDGTDLPDAAITPHAILDAENLLDFFERNDSGLSLRQDAETRLGLVTPQARVDHTTKGKVIGFMPHYPAHSWYREMTQAMSARAAAYGMELRLSPPAKEIANEITRLRTEIAQDAARRVRPGETIILGQGEATEALALALLHRAVDDPAGVAGVTIITNALDILQQFREPHPFKVILTSGELQKTDNCLVGPSVGAVFDRLRADVAFIAASGLTPDFGLSIEDERLALASSRFVAASRRTIALVDHTVLGTDATHRICKADVINEIITDDGALPADRQRLRSAGVDVHIAGEAAEDAPQNVGARPAFRGSQAIP